MADNPSVRAGTAGGTIVVAADEVTIYGSAAQIQGMKIHDGLEGGTIGARVTSSGELVTVQMNSGTVSVTGTPNVHVTNAATVAVTGTPNVHVTNNGTVNGGTLLGHMGTVHANIANNGTVSVTGTPNVHITNAATVTLTGTNPVFVTNNGTVNGGTILGQMGTVHANIANNGTVSVTGTPNVHVTNAATVIANGGTILGQAGTVTALQGTNPWLVNAWLLGAATATLTGTNPVFVTNNGTVSVTGTPNIHVTNAATVTLTGTNPTFQTNSGTVIQGTDPWRTHQTNSGTVSVSSLSGTVSTLEQGGTVIAHVSNSGTVIQGTNPWLVSSWQNSASTVHVSTAGTILGALGTVSITGTPNIHITNAATVIANGGTLLGQAGTVSALQGTNPWLVSAWLNSAATVNISSAGTILGALGTVSVTGTPNVHITNAATVNQGGAPWTVTANGGTVLGQMGTVNVAGTPNVHLTNAATVSVSNLGKAEDSVHASGDTGIMALAVRNDAGTVFAVDGDYVPLSTDSAGAVRVTGGGGGVQYTEGDIDATLTGTMALAEGPSDTATPLQVDAAKLLQVDIAADSVGIGGGVQYVEDVAHASGGTGVMSLAVRVDSGTALAGTDQDYIPLSTDSAGALWMHVAAGTVAVSGTPNVHITNSATVVANGGTILGQAGTVTALQGTNPWLVNAWLNSASTVNVNSGGTLLGALGTVNINGTPNVFVTNEGTVAVKGNVWVGNNGTVSITGTPNVHITNSATVAALPGGITGFAEDAGHTTGDVGIQSLAVRKNVAAALAGADADYTPLISDDVGAAWVHANDGTVAIKGNVLVGNNGTVTLTGTNPVFVTNSGTVNGGTILGQMGTVNIAGTPNVHLTNSSTVIQGTNPWLTSTWLSSASTVTISALPGGIVGFAEDAGHTTGDVGIMSLAVRKNVAAAVAGADADYTPLTSDDVGAVWAHVNDGTVAIKGNVVVGNNGTVSVTGTPNVHLTNSSTVIQGTNPWLVNAWLLSAATATLTGTNPVFVTNNGTVTLTGTNPVFVTNSGTIAALPGGITGFAEDAGHTTGDIGIQALAVRKNVAAALAGADLDYTPLTSDDVGAQWVHANDGTVAIKGNVVVGNNGTVSVTGTPNVHVTNAATVTLTGTNPTFQTNSGTVIQGTNPWLVNAWLLASATATLTGTNPVFVTNNGTVSVTGTPNIHVTNAATVTATDLDIRNLVPTQDSITVGSAIIGLGHTLGGTNILLTASGTVVPSVSSRILYVTHEALTCQGGTITITARNGDGGGTLWGPMQFSPTGGMAVSAGIQNGGLYETASGSAVYYELAGSGTVGGRIRWARLAS